VGSSTVARLRVFDIRERDSIEFFQNRQDFLTSLLLLNLLDERARISLHPDHV
jgi:hypothetical protein